ncbi:sensor histidine kinase [Paraburkholderia sp. J12]|uniref:sensor histidine kinase n=1 Tax=Paraburkholderia sp. J12 TaxID=2805432 RepID=UPI002ABE0AF3|nr:histidine kinase [Paraburkholderia sp. J12]
MWQDASPGARRVLTALGLATFNCLIGIALWADHADADLVPYLMSANGIGFSAWFFSTLADRLARRKLGVLPKVLIVTPLSVVAGFEIAASTVGHAPHLFGPAGIERWLAYGSSFIIAAAACALFTLAIQTSRMRTSLEIERRKAADARQAETAARLALLQAQIEPHFLFNTLANVQSLIERDPARANAMLSSLNHYLRGSLGRTRAATSTLGEELDLCEALLKIASIRLEERLRYTFEIPPAVRHLPFSPLLLQPLVENAIRHGIEPAVEGGEIRVRAALSGGMLTLGVTDSGVGLAQGTTGALHGGVGLNNVRTRLRSLYGERSRLDISDNAAPAKGVTATLLLPTH